VEKEAKLHDKRKHYKIVDIRGKIEFLTPLTVTGVEALKCVHSTEENVD
jgi:hypothetical protein